MGRQRYRSEIVESTNLLEVHTAQRMLHARTVADCEHNGKPPGDPHPHRSTPPHPKWRFTFAILIWPWLGGGGANAWPSDAWDAESGADLDWGQNPDDPAALSSPPAPLGLAWRRQAMAK